MTVSRDPTTIDSVRPAAEARGLFVRKLNSAVAYHSQHTETVATPYRAAIGPFYNTSFEAERSGPLLLSSVTGQVVSSATVDADYWVQNLVRPVRYSDAITIILTLDQQSAESPNILVEIGPHPALKNPTKQILQSPQATKSLTKI